MCLQTPRLYGFCHVSHGVYFIPPKKRLRLLHVMCGLKNAAKFQRTQIWEFRRDLKLVWLGCHQTNRGGRSGSGGNGCVRVVAYKPFRFFHSRLSLWSNSKVGNFIIFRETQFLS
mmetsp:Transcript_43458/g.43983  ORF Transcript_43458/g.43983 Transcript_43458/m.43983 type:complete len:115 (-) Transcript_43458:44-388(-)